MKKILIVEDEATLRKSLVDKFTVGGYLVLEAIDGDQGLETALKERPDLIIIDIIMSKSSGLIFLEKLRLDTWGKEAQVIVLTNVNESSYMIAAQRAHVDEYILKANVKIEDLFNKVKLKLK